MLPKKVVPDQRQCFDMVHDYVIDYDYSVLNVTVKHILFYGCHLIYYACYTWSIRYIYIYTVYVIYKINPEVNCCWMLYREFALK